MMRLMSDLIVYLRDLLVFKAKPDALTEDVDPDVQKALAAHADSIETDLTGRILRGETAGALDVLYQQSETGKDMMRLMSDLIVYLRDLLVFKAKPDALTEDVR